MVGVFGVAEERPYVVLAALHVHFTSKEVTGLSPDAPPYIPLALKEVILQSGDPLGRGLILLPRSAL